MEERIASLVSLCRAEPLLIDCPVELAVVCCRPVPFKEVAEESPVWLLSPEFVKVINLLSRNEGLSKLSINRGLTQGATSGAIIDSAFRVILPNITSLHLSDVDPHPSHDPRRSAIIYLASHSSLLRLLRASWRWSGWLLYILRLPVVTVILTCGTCNEGDLRAISTIPEQAANTLQYLAVDLTSLTSTGRLALSLLHGRLTIPSLLLMQLIKVAVTFWVSDFRGRLHGGRMRDPSTSVAALLSSITVSSPLAVEFNCIISEGSRHFDWGVIDRAIDELAKYRTHSNHITLSLRYKLPAPCSSLPAIGGYPAPRVEFNVVPEEAFPLPIGNASVTVAPFTQRDIAHEGWDEL
ncbi:hypothetical protein BKA70DRAFT_1479950 [Coprinopsis sp. MPI-PUGE-AT-0042]|nr:hypothetical protein BKA70DRAFT_1479950 [Coprinopsis sp. MPI-PUGE-AT-0042]